MKIKKSSELLWALGNIFVGLGVAICSKADLGVSMIAAPAFIVSQALQPLSSFFSVGVTEYLIQGLLLVVLCIVIRRFNWRFLLGFAVAVIYGYTLNFFLWLLSPVSFDAVWMRYVALIVGDICTGFGVACFFRTRLPLQVYELFVAELSKRFSFSINKTKFAFDISLLAVSLVLALSLFGDVLQFDWSTITSHSFHSIGLGTVITTALNSPIITFCGKAVDRIFDPAPLFPKICNAIGQSEA